ncbi:MAG: polyprenyl synthetase family protein [Planctomycetota bacterium]
MTSSASETPTSGIDHPGPLSASNATVARHQTAHLKLVPEPRRLRDRIHCRCEQVAAELDKTHPLSKKTMQAVARAILQELELPEGYAGWTMVGLASAFWRDQVAAVPPSRRLLLLPHCLKHPTRCRATYDELGLQCQQCGACPIGGFRRRGVERGYQTLVAEGSPIVMTIILSGKVDAIVGIACLNVLENTIDKVLLSGIPCMAVPLLASTCKATSVDEDRVRELLLLEHTEPGESTATYVHLMRAASDMFTPDRLEALVPRARNSPRLNAEKGAGIEEIEPIAATEAIAYDFLAKGGKHSRPFITLAVHDALTGGHATKSNGAEHISRLSDSVFRTAMSIETFHKASLVHDDIEDDDAFRYGTKTIHRQYGAPTAINVGDYLIGMGYRLVTREAAALGPEAAGDILGALAEAHTRLSEGQGAELLWRDARDKRLTPLDALKIYALKTAPAFEAAILAGIRLAGLAEPYRDSVKQFARNLGVAFQILNDLNDWHGDQDNKRAQGGDILGGRPTVLWALALEHLDADQRERLQRLVKDSNQLAQQRITQVRQLYEKAHVIDKAQRLIDKHQQRATTLADQLDPPELQRLFHYLIEVVLDRPSHQPRRP